MANMNGSHYIIVSECKTFRREVVEILQEHLPENIVVEKESVEELLRTNNIHLAKIIFVHITGIINSDVFHIIKILLWYNRFLRIVGVFTNPHEKLLIATIEAGFIGCLDYTHFAEELDPAMAAIRNGHYYFSKYLFGEILVKQHGKSC